MMQEDTVATLPPPAQEPAPIPAAVAEPLATEPAANTVHARSKPQPITITPQSTIRVLRVLYRRDPAAVASLVSMRVGCGPSLAEARGAVVFRNEEFKERPLFGALELVNSLFGGSQCIEPVLNARGAIVDFKLVKPCPATHDTNSTASVF